MRVPAVNGAAAFKACFIPDDEAPALGSAPDSRWRREPSSTLMLARPRAPQPAPETALLRCRHGALSVLGVQNGGD